LGVADRLADTLLELPDAVGEAGHSPLAGVPVAGRHVVQHLSQAVLRQRFRQHLLLVGIGKEVLDAPEAVLGGGGKAVEEVVLAVEHGEIGGKPGHSLILLERPDSLRGRGAPESMARRYSAGSSAASSPFGSPLGPSVGSRQRISSNSFTVSSSAPIETLVT